MSVPSKEITVAVLAGGRGKRMGEITNQTQKCLLEVGGKPVLTHILDNVIQAFGSANVVIALGYKGDEVRTHYGSAYGSLSMSYVQDDRSLETRKRLLLARDYLLPTPYFMFLAGDIICHPDQLAKVAQIQEGEKNYSLGIVSVTDKHDPAPSHALMTVKQNKVTEIAFPPTKSWSANQYREMHVACYTAGFLKLLENTPEDVLYLSSVLMRAVQGGQDLVASLYHKNWYHFAEVKDLMNMPNQDGLIY